MANTGYKGYANLLKVTDDGTNRPLDINNNLCSESGLPQATKTNDISDPDYIAPVLDETTCPSTGGPFYIESSRISSGVGYLDIMNGEPGEVINLSFAMDSSGTFSSLSFSAPATVAVLDPLHVSRTGTMTLDSSGNGRSNYLFDPISADRACLVTITSRSSGSSEGVGNSTNVI